jgi:hypothetical protein
VVLDGVGQAQSVFLVPNLSWLVGVTTWVAGITVDPSYQTTIKSWSAPLSVTIVP